LRSARNGVATIIAHVGCDNLAVMIVVKPKLNLSAEIESQLKIRRTQHGASTTDTRCTRFTIETQASCIASRHESRNVDWTTSICEKGGAPWRALLWLLAAHAALARPFPRV
jgi:hypothetical protein